MNALTEKKGFEGQVSDLHLSDIIQMNCLGHSTGSLVIEKDNERGIIYFDDGNIIHAEIGDWKGEDAFYEILSWQGGRFSQKKGVHAPRETISKSWQNLLLEGLRQLDETTPVSSDQKEAEKMKRVNKINSALNEIGKIHGVSLVAVVTPDGFPISSIITKGGEPKNYDISMITTAIPPGLKYAGTISKEINGGEMKLLTVEFEDVLCLAGTIPNREEILFVIAQPAANLGAIRLEVRKQGNQIRNFL
jgi:predicted regulator of Ras-like GTPase activity (Roadblock/LC7/MglB family)